MYFESFQHHFLHCLLTIMGPPNLLVKDKREFVGAIADYSIYISNRVNTHINRDYFGSTLVIQYNVYICYFLSKSDQTTFLVTIYWSYLLYWCQGLCHNNTPRGKQNVPIG